MPRESAASAAREKWREAWRTSRDTPSPLAETVSRRELRAKTRGEWRVETDLKYITPRIRAARGCRWAAGLQVVSDGKQRARGQNCGMEGEGPRCMLRRFYDVCLNAGTCVRATTCCSEVPASAVMQRTRSVQSMRVQLTAAANGAQGRGGDAPHCNLNVLIATGVGTVMHFS